MRTYKFANGVKAYSYPELINEMPNILEHPEEYEELQKDMESIGHTKSDDRKSWLGKLKSFVNNYIMENHLKELYGFDYDLVPNNPTFDYLEIRDGRFGTDFYCQKFDNMIEVKTYVSSRAVFDCAIPDIEFVYGAETEEDFWSRKSWLWENYHRYVQIYDADVVWFAVPSEDILICYNVHNHKHYVLKLKFKDKKQF